MARRNPTELIAGAAVLLVAGVFLGYVMANTGRTAMAGMTLRAKFERIDGLNVGADVRLAGAAGGGDLPADHAVIGHCRQLGLDRQAVDLHRATTLAQHRQQEALPPMAEGIAASVDSAGAPSES